jgi:aspartyl-tRNA(Asn)/glutamyl-tRNA(Gln) amidotransferase subunit B
MLRGLYIQGQKHLWKACIGLEIHAQVSAGTKLFSEAGLCSHIKFPKPNNYVTLYDCGMPGTYPQLNKFAVEQGIRAALALNCRVNNETIFERKHYFYHDMPLGYQVTQQVKPIAEAGVLEVHVEKDSDGQESVVRVDIDRLQLEQDSGKSAYIETFNDDTFESSTVVDLNRAGSALLEIVFAPQLCSAPQAAATLNRIQHLFRHLRICDGKIDKGNLRCDVNISVSKEGAQELGQRVEIKNLNGPNNVQNAIEYEVRRQIEVLEAQEEAEPGSNAVGIIPETRGFDDVANKTFHMRYKLSTIDYRIFPDPDLLTLTITDSEIAAVQESMIELPEVTLARLQTEYAVDSTQAQFLMTKPEYLLYFEEICRLNQDSSLLPFKTIYNWLVVELHGILLQYGNSMDDLSAILHNECVGDGGSVHEQRSVLNSLLKPEYFYDILRLVYFDNQLSNLQAKKLLDIVVENQIRLFSSIGGSATEGTILDMHRIASEYDLLMISDETAILQLCQQSIENPNNCAQLKRFHSKKKSKGNGVNPTWKYFFGDIMKSSNNRVNPLVLEKHLIPLLLSTTPPDE